MDATLLRMLDSPNPAERKQAIKKLAQSGDPEALKYLNALYKTENDPEIKDLAIKAGKYLRQQLGESVSANQADYNRNWQGRAPQESPRKAKEEEPVLAKVSKNAEERSKGMMETAMEALVARKQEDAHNLAKKAFALNPNLQYDAYYRGFAAEIMGTSQDEAVAELLAGTKTREQKRKNDAQGSDQGDTWGAAFGDLIIAFLVIAGATIISFLLASSAFGQAIREFSDLSSQNDILTAQLMTGIWAWAASSMALSMVLSTSSLC